MSDQDATERFAKAIRELDLRHYVLRLYVVGATPASQRAIANLRQICETELSGRYELEVVDIYQQPTLAKGEQIIAAPTLVKKLPAPLRRFIGSMADMERILVGLDLKPMEKTPPQDTKKGHKTP